MERTRHNVGELRPSQLMFTYGVGAIVDLPHISVLVMGLEDWDVRPGYSRELSEERLLNAVRHQLGQHVQKLLTPPVAPESAAPTSPFDLLEQAGVPVATFPRWMLCPRCQTLAPLASGLFEMKTSPYHPERTHFVHSNCQKAKRPPSVVPARFLVACPNGHLDDFPWVEFTHRGPTSCHSHLILIEYGPSGEARDVEVRCNGCDASRRLAEAFGEADTSSMPMCRGRRPHLRDYVETDCQHQVKAILLGASNLWFPEILTTLAIPGKSAAQLDALVDEQWGTLNQLRNVQNVELLRNLGQIGELLGYGNEEIWQAIERRRSQAEDGAPPIDSPMDLKSPEWERFIRPQDAPTQEGFLLRAVDPPDSFLDVLEQVVLAEKLREVRALIGFTRIDAPGEWGEVAAQDDGRRMALSRSPQPWIPAAEIRGEGIFLRFREDKIQHWLQGDSQVEWEEKFLNSHSRWRTAHYISNPEDNFPGLRYVLLHSFAHALMRRLCLECGYSAAGLRERIYARDPYADDKHLEPMAGVLIYTAAPDSEGTLGGLVSLGNPAQLGRHIEAALRDTTLCGSDPLCAEHPPSRRGLTLHAAACHACLFAPETSCESGNRYLDRSVLVQTLEQEELAFFPNFK